MSTTSFETASLGSDFLSTNSSNASVISMSTVESFKSEYDWNLEDWPRDEEGQILTTQQARRRMTEMKRLAESWGRLAYLFANPQHRREMERCLEEAERLKTFFDKQPYALKIQPGKPAHQWASETLRMGMHKFDTLKVLDPEVQVLPRQITPKDKQLRRHVREDVHYYIDV
ncbi:hypothetical protein BDN70DRAFT_939509 [Pholiota conissans]|uniref:Uncharacterized protein n=1 Tax=Pholiota conissans TaxID=109636 RepID=A0A9P5YMT7_9AGAR|nr:hypothetical protein BDN70DRAFT_939509 [Pholiota conissans]